MIKIKAVTLYELDLYPAALSYLQRLHGKDITLYTNHDAQVQEHKCKFFMTHEDKNELTLSVARRLLITKKPYDEELAYLGVELNLIEE